MKLTGLERNQTPTKRRRLWVDLSWVVAFLLVCTLSYQWACTKDEELLYSLTTTYEQLKNLKDDALYLRKELVAQIESQGDTEWVELLLKEKLGVVPQGQKKIFFEFSENP